MVVRKHCRGKEEMAGESVPVSSSQGLTSKTIMDFVNLAFSAALFLAASTICASTPKSHNGSTDITPPNSLPMSQVQKRELPAWLSNCLHLCLSVCLIACPNAPVRAFYYILVCSSARPSPHRLVCHVTVRTWARKYPLDPPCSIPQKGGGLHPRAEDTRVHNSRPLPHIPSTEQITCFTENTRRRVYPGFTV